MRKIIICNMTMRESIEPLVYQTEDGSLRVSDRAVIYPVLSCIRNMLSPADSVKIVLFCKCDPNGNYLRNVSRFQKEFDEQCDGIGIEPEYQFINTEFDEEREATEKLLSQIVSACEDGAEIISDITYGTKTMPVVLLAALSFAVKHLGCKVRHIFYGQVYFQDGVPTQPKICDLSDLIYLNSLLNTLHCDSPGKAREALVKLLEL